VKLIYPGIGGKPVIVVAVRCILSGQLYHAKMLIDTGADETCFPAAFAQYFGHDNSHPDVEIVPNAVMGIGGSANAFIHSVQISLLDPKKSKKTIAWTSAITRSQFIDKLDCFHGIIGMDIIKSWKSFTINPLPKGGILLGIEL
jgi:hypothetical protein